MPQREEEPKLRPITVPRIENVRVEGNVLRKKSVLIPDGSPVRGRVRLLEWNEEKDGYYVVGLEFTVNGQNVTGGGKAVFSFSVTNAGNYVIEAEAHGPSWRSTTRGRACRPARPKLPNGRVIWG